MGHLSEDIKPSERMARLGSSGASGPPPASPECSSNSHKAPLETHAFARAGIRGGFQKTQNIGIANSVSFFQRTSFPPSTNGHYVKAVQNRSPEEAPSAKPSLRLTSQGAWGQATASAIQSPHILFFKYFISGRQSLGLRFDFVSINGFLIV